MSPDETVRLAVVGTGLIGVVHAARVASCPSTELAVLCGLDDGVPGLAGRMRVPLVTDYREIISHDVDGVVVATPNQLHEPIGSFFLEHDLPVLVEKPIADTVSGGVELCRRISCRGADPRRTPPSS